MHHLCVGVVPGYTFTSMKDSTGNNIVDLPLVSLADMAAACEEAPACVGFNSNGQLKSALGPVSSWVSLSGNKPGNKFLGLYKRDEGMSDVLRSVMFSSRCVG